MSTRANNKPTTEDSPHVVIIGGGITGLSAAWYLQQAQYDGVNIRYTVLEQAERWGGKVKTDLIEGDDSTPFVIEGGPDSFLTQKPWALQMARELGLEDEFLPTNDHKRTIYILNKGKLRNLPDGLYLIAPTRIWPFAKSSLFSPLGKLRMGLDLIMPAAKNKGDESLADFIGRRMGREAVDKLAEPLMAGIYNADADRLSIMATFPRFREMEAEYGSLIRGMLAANKLRPATPKNDDPPKKRLGMFISFKQGTQVMIDALSQQLTGDLRLNSGVNQVTRQEDGTYSVMLANGDTLQADVVILAVPAYIAAKLTHPIAPQAADLLNQIRYVSTATLTLAYKEADLARPLDGFGVVIPASEKRRINALTWSSTKFDHRAPQGYGLVRVFLGGSKTPEMAELPDEETISMARDEVREIMGITAEPQFHRLYRWTRSTPQYDVGHLDLVASIEAQLPAGLYVTGSPYRGVGMPDCVHQAKQTVEIIKAQIRAEAPTLQEV